ncbi:hypothetical protein NA57DRAFT_75038 [Rhizodiscina lignyota]|uniref:Xylanolytic transcriptional activator regulatory domain-containing protein n=1 Tax=Rhizodiscina lignyota TaxID=1504668 RepID=A0A9P4M6P6_9PEZI|nr:hypothetical protein NA57DRAFT_75038 [Rhizodiscina lignyota]
MASTTRPLNSFWFLNRFRHTRLDVLENQLHHLENIESLLRDHSAAIKSLQQHQSIATSTTPPHGSKLDTVPAPALSRSSQEENAPSVNTPWDINRSSGIQPPGPETADSFALPPLTIPLGHQTSNSNLLVLPQMRSLLGEFPKEFLFMVEDSRVPSVSAHLMAGPTGTAVPINLPSVQREDGDEYLERFFISVHSFHPIFDQDELYAQYHDIMQRGFKFDIPSALILTVLALGATAPDSPDRSDRLSGAELICAAFRILLSHWAVSFSGDITLSQALVLSALYFTYAVEPLMAWKSIHMASTSIQQILIHAIPPDDAHAQDMIRISWACFLIECDILAEYHQPRSGIEPLVDKMPFPKFSNSSNPETLFFLAEIPARSILNRVHHAVYFTDTISIYTGSFLSVISSTLPPSPNPDVSLLRVCAELNHQLETWYDSLPDVIKPDLAADPVGSRQACLLRLRYWSAKQVIYRPFVIYVTSLAPEQAAVIPPSVLDMCSVCLNSCRFFLQTADHVLSERSSYTYSTAQW